jgi:hypothetical protein
MQNISLKDFLASPDQYRSIKNISIVSYKEFTSLKCLEGFTVLEKLSLEGKFKDLETISKLSFLKSLSLLSLKNNTNLDFLKSLTSLEDLRISNGSIKQLESLKDLFKLQSLKLVRIKDLSVEDLVRIIPQHVQKLRLELLPHIVDFNWLVPFAHLKVLEFNTLNGLTSLQGLEKIQNLEVVNISGDFKNKKNLSIQELLKCTKLKELYICPNVAAQKINLEVCKQLKHIIKQDNGWKVSKSELNINSSFNDLKPSMYESQF